MIYRIVMAAALGVAFTAGVYCGGATHWIEEHRGRLPETPGPEAAVWILATAVVVGAGIGWTFGFRVGVHATRLRLGGEVADVLAIERARRQGKRIKTRARLGVGR